MKKKYFVAPMLLALLTTGLRAQTESCFQEDIKPMVKTLWGQYAPYNMLCPANENDGNITHDLAGCGPVAMAQTINFHRYPDMSPDGKYAYDWKLMFKSMSPSLGTENLVAVAKLINDCRVSVFTEYNDSNSTSNMKEIAGGMKRLFKYSRYMHCVSRNVMQSHGRDEVFKELLFGELEAGRPVIYRGVRTEENESDNAHIFIIDGCRDGMVHVNMGWEGKDDGYYELDDINGYRYHQWMIIGIADSSYVPGIRQIDVTCPGTLAQSLSPDDRHLSITGRLNDDDITALRALARASGDLRTIDMSRAMLDELPDSAFKECRSINIISLPAGMRSIGHYAFAYCNNLSHVDLPDSLTTIGKWAFAGCHGLLAAALPPSLRAIHAGAFASCHDLQTVRIPEGVEYLGNNAFQKSQNLRSLYLPESLKRMGRDITKSCSKLTRVTIAPGNPYFRTEGTEISMKGSNGEPLPARTVTVDEPGTLAQKISAADWGLTITGTLNTDDIMALRMMAGDDGELGYLDMSQAVIPTLPDSAFAKCSKLTEVRLPESMERIERHAFSGCHNLERVVIPKALKIVLAFAFYKCAELKEVKLPTTLTAIGPNAFAKCSSLSDVSIPEGVEYVGSNAFSNCQGLRTLNFPKSLKRAGKTITNGCSSLTSVTIGAGNTTFTVRGNELQPIKPQRLTPRRR